MRRTSIVTGVCLLGLSLVFGQLLVRPTSGQGGDAAPSRQTGRYQLASSPPNMIVIDTATGRVWQWQHDTTWTAFGSPAEPRRK
jgi:hypothetical protein